MFANLFIKCMNYIESLVDWSYNNWRTI